MSCKNFHTTWSKYVPIALSHIRTYNMTMSFCKCHIRFSLRQRFIIHPHHLSTICKNIQWIKELFVWVKQILPSFSHIIQKYVYWWWNSRGNQQSQCVHTTTWRISQVVFIIFSVLNVAVFLWLISVLSAILFIL